MSHNPAISALQSVIEWTEDEIPAEIETLPMRIEWYKQRMCLIRNCARAGIQAATKEPRREQQQALDL